jgi:hypothetical protein
MVTGYTFSSTAATGYIPSAFISYTSGGLRFPTLNGGNNPFVKINNMTTSDSRVQGHYSTGDALSKGIKNLIVVPLPANFGLDFRLSSLAQTPTLSIDVVEIATRKPFLFLVSGEVSTSIQPITIATGNYSTLVNLTDYPILNWSSMISFNTEANITKSTQLNITGGVSSFSWNNITRTSGTQTGLVYLFGSESFFHNQRGVRTVEITRPIVNGIQIYADVVLGIHHDDYIL